MARHAAYRNVKSKKTEIDGIKFASPGEAERYLELMIRIAKGENIEVFLQPSFELQPKFKKCCTLLYSPCFEHPELTTTFNQGICPLCGKKMKHEREIRYLADFKIVHGDGTIEIEDVKGWGGYTTPEFKLKRKLFEFNYPELSLSLLKRLGKPKRIAELLAEREALNAKSP